MSILIDDAENERKAIIATTHNWRTIAENAEAAIEQALYYLDHHAPGRAREVLALAHERKCEPKDGECSCCGKVHPGHDCGDDLQP